MRICYLALGCLLIPSVLWAQADTSPLGPQPGSLPPVIVEAPRPGQPTYQPQYDPTAGYNGGYQRGPISWDSGAIGSDTDLVGPYGQPQWTTQRPFSTARVYVLPEGVMQVEQWVRPTYKRDEKPEFRFLEEYAIGLPNRFQLDIYERWNVEPNGSNREQANHEGIQVELRYALADWGVLPLNPTLYIEWVERGGPQEKPNKYEAKLLLADQITPRWFYASNFILEQEVDGDELENELGWSNALSTPIIDRKLMAGFECLWSGTTVRGGRDNRTNEFTIGPTMQWRPSNRTFFNTTALFGTTPDSPVCQCYFIFGYQFGRRAGPAKNYIGAPSSTIGN